MPRYINIKDTPSSYSTEWKLQCGLTRQGKNCECHPAQSFLLIILGGYMLLFHQSTMRIIYCVWYVFSTFCDVIVVKYFQFMKNSLYWYPSPLSHYKIGSLGNFGRMYGLLTGEVCFCRAKKAQLIVRPGLAFLQECVCACGCRKWERLISLC